jgi:hypothetical protein
MQKIFPGVLSIVLLLLLLFCGLTSSAEAQKKISPSVRGIKLGTTYVKVTRQFGEPLSERDGGKDSCNGEKLILRYPGVIFTLDGETALRYYIVISIEVTSPKYPFAPPVAVGASLAKVQSKFGRNGKLTKEAGGQKLSYLIKDGFADFYFRKNKLVRAVWRMNPC